MIIGLLIYFPPGSAGSHLKSSKKPTEPKYVVLLIEGLDGKSTIEVMEESLERIFRKDLEATYKKAIKNWGIAQKAAKDQKADFSDPKPQRPKIRVLKKGLTKEAAQTLKREKEAAWETERSEQISANSGKPVKYSVAMITGMYKSVVFKVLQDDMVKPQAKELETEYKDAIKTWEAAKKDAKKDKNEFVDPKPSKPSLKVLKRGLTRDKADSLMQKEEAKYEKKTAVADKNVRTDKKK